MNWRDHISQNRILVVGDVMLDRYWFGDVDRISPEAPVPVVRVRMEDERLGGAGNVARNVVSLGAQCSLLTVVGDDEPGKRIEELAWATGIEFIGTRAKELRTTLKLRILGRQQQLLRADFEEAPNMEALAATGERYEVALANCDAVVMSDYGKGGLAHVAQLIECARAAKKPVFVDPKGGDWSKYRGATMITPNRSELKQVVGRWESETELASKAESLRQDLNLQALLVTRSEEGMSLFTGSNPLHVKAAAREVFDVTGAGDTVIAVMASLVAAGLSMEEAMPLANKAGGIVVGRVGTATVASAELLD